GLRSRSQESLSRKIGLNFRPPSFADVLYGLATMQRRHHVERKPCWLPEHQIPAVESCEDLSNGEPPNDHPQRKNRQLNYDTFRAYLDQIRKQPGRSDKSRSCRSCNCPN